MGQQYSKLWTIFVLGPLILAPLLAVEFPRILAYLPLVSLFTGGAILWRGKTQIMFPKKPAFVLLGVLALGALSVYGVAPSEDASERFSKLILFFVLGSAFLTVLYSGRHLVTPHFTKIILAACSIAALLICAEVSLGAPIYQIIRSDVDPSKYTMAVFNRGALVVTFISLFVLFVERNKRELSFYALYLPILAMLFFVESQSSQITVIAGLLFYFAFPTSKKFAWYALYGLLFVATWLAPFGIQKAFNQLPDNVHDTPILQTAYVGNRMEIWDFVARKALEKPFSGHGLEYTKNCTAFDSAQRFLKGDSVLHPHSAVLQIWIEFGVSGIAVFLMLAAWLFCSIYRIEDGIIRKASTSIAAVMFLVSCFSYGMWQSWWLGLLFIISAIILSMLPQKQHKA